MEENWYAVEQQVRDRLNEARAAARTRALIQKLAPPARRPYSIRLAVIRLAGRVLAQALALPLKLSRALANVRAATKRCQSTNALLAGKESRP
jgi:hypothetical protein